MVPEHRCRPRSWIRGPGISDRRQALPKAITSGLGPGVLPKAKLQRKPDKRLDCRVLRQGLAGVGVRSRTYIPASFAAAMNADLACFAVSRPSSAPRHMSVAILYFVPLSSGQSRRIHSVASSTEAMDLICPPGLVMIVTCWKGNARILQNAAHRLRFQRQGQSRRRI